VKSKRKILYKSYFANELLETHLRDKQIIKVPAAPGTVPIPSNHLRLYHYTTANAKDIERDGLKLSKSKGHTYGEPNFVWASLAQPGRYKRFVEFHVPIDDPRFSLFGSKPDVSRGAAFYKDKSNDFTFNDDIKPSEFIAIHEPWHHSYRYMVDQGEEFIQSVLNGEFDYITPDKFPDEAEAIAAIKTNYENN
jgi:hypothetical protein